MSESPEIVNFDYIKSNLFRTARADGAVASVNGHGDIILNIYSERTPIPQRSVHSVVDGRLSEEISDQRVVRDAIIREIEISVSMSMPVARSLQRLLSNQISFMEKQVAQAGEKKTGDKKA